MSAFDRLLPREANNDYQGSAVAFYGFCVLTVVICGRSLIHFLKDDSGVNSIATIITFSGTPDPNNVIYMYSALWGTQQIITVLIYGVVLLRYRNLIPLMFLLMIVEVVLRMSVGQLHPLTPEYFLRPPPGKVGNLPLLVVSGVMLFLSLRARRPVSDTAAPAASHGRELG